MHEVNLARGLESFPELESILECSQYASHLGRVKEESYIRYKNHEFPILSFEFGIEKGSCPTLVFVGGIHGLEKVGTEVVLSYLRSFMRLLKWDKVTQEIMSRCRLAFYPLANPVGMYRGTRANGRGVDIMRNSSVNSEAVRFPLLGGHRISGLLPWFRGWADQKEQETSTLIDFIDRQRKQASLLLTLDVHSGFGRVDRLWFPYASSPDVFPETHRLLKLKKNLDLTYPHHVYVMEPQSRHYTVHGDLWDEMYLKNTREQGCPFIPLSLEMGSWAWILKNPKQILTSSGIFNPILPHRLQRTQRRHLLLCDFLLRSIYSLKTWSEMTEEEATYLRDKAIKLWYRPR